MEIKVQQLKPEELKKMGVLDWPVWRREVSKFPWSYDAEEECYFLEGEVTIHKDDGTKLEIGKGDFVTFPKGLSCIWDIKKTVKKHYSFK